MIRQIRKTMKHLRILLQLWCGAAAASKARDDFVAKMDQAGAERQRDARATSRLLEVARPVEGTSRFLEQYGNIDFNITNYALRYIGCQNVHQYSDWLAQSQDADSVLGMNRFVIVRLCPKDECSNYHHYGCNHGYGDYLIPMEDYLTTMAEEYFMEYQNYCETCYYCKQQQSQANATDGANGGRRMENDDAYYYKGADFYNNNNNNNNEAEEQDVCANMNTACANFKSACKDYSQYATGMESYFQCSDFQIGDYSGHLGPHCRSDGKTIGIGLYKDSYCNDYNSDLVDVSSTLGMDLSDVNLKAYYSDQCISCNATENYGLYEENGGEEVTPICGALYDISAKCNRYMGNNDDYMSENQADNEGKVCTFIHNLITNTYDEYGHIYMQNGWKSYVPDVRSMTTFQKWAMSFSILSAVGLFLYAAYLHRTISGAKYAWHPNQKNRRAGLGNPAEIRRMHSGIIQGRSRSELHDGAVFA